MDSRYHLKLGWFAVRNRSSKEVLGEASFEERDEKEIELFESGIWKEAVSSSSYLNSIDPNVLGIKRLKHTLQQSLYKRVKENFPILKTKMRGLKKRYDEQLQLMGGPRDNPGDQRVYLSDIQSKYESEVERSLNGNYRAGLSLTHASRLRYLVVKFNDNFAEEMREKALKYSWQLLDQDAPNDQGPSGEEPRAGIFQWIEQSWDYHLGSEYRGDAPSGLKKVLFKEQTYSWETRTRTYMTKVNKAIRDCNADLFKTACEDDALRDKIREKLEPLETKAFAAAEEELQQIIGDLDYLHTWNPHFEGHVWDVQFPRRTRQVGQLNQLKPGEGPEDPVEKQMLQYQSFIATNQRVFEVHDWLLGYWRAAFPRFVDNIIIQVVERHLLGRKGPLRLFNRHWIDRLDREELEDLVGEDEATVNERKSVKEKLDGLEDALKKADIALR